jgi:sugar/nucleoside kinase (ribokinase family)
MPAEDQSRVVIVGELHQDLFYRMNHYSEIAQTLAKQLKNKNFHEMTGGDLEREILKIIDETPKKIGGDLYNKRGGNGNNSATLLAKLKIPVALMTTIGKGTSWMFDELKALGIQTDYVYQVESPGPISTIIEDPKITKILIAPALKEKMNFESITIPNSAFDNAKIVFFTPIADKYTKVLEQVSQLNSITAITVETQKIQNKLQLSKCCSIKSHLLFANLNDGAFILGKEINDHSEQAILARLTDVDREFAPYSEVRIFTLGKYGAWICIDKLAPINIPVIPTEVRNRTGAGDTFAAGFIAFLFDQVKTAQDYAALNPEKKIGLLSDCAKYATAAASLKVSSGEAPDRKKLDEYFTKKYK